jgi:hypothetical protein
MVVLHLVLRRGVTLRLGRNGVHGKAGGMPRGRRLSALQRHRRGRGVRHRLPER